MVKHWMLAFCFCFGWIPAAIAVENGTYIEQEVSQGAVANQPPMRGIQKIWMTPDFVRNEMNFGEQTSVAIIDLKQKKIILMPSDEKQYIEMKMEEYQRIVAMRLNQSGLNDPKAEPKLTETGEQKKIGDWQCKKILFEQGGVVPVKSELWVAKDTGIDFNVYVELMKKMGLEQMLGKLAGFVKSVQGYPIEVRTEQTVDNQKIVSTTRVLKIAIGPVDPALFKTPDGYRRIGGEKPLGN
jgi:hypothetical protein